MFFVEVFQKELLRSDEFWCKDQRNIYCIIEEYVPECDEDVTAALY